MIENILILIIGMILGACLIMCVILVSILRGQKKKDHPTKEEWRHM